MLARWTLTALTGIVFAGVLGVLAWLLSPVAPGVSGVVFTAVALPFGGIVGWVFFVAPRTVPVRPHADESVEKAWLSTALAGTATDLVLVVGLGLTAISITRTELPTQPLLLAVLLVAFASTALRYVITRGRALQA